MSKIFIVDDDVFITRMYERIFRFANHEIEVAHDGVEALDRLASMEVMPDVIAMDVVMPKMTGLELLEKIRTNEKTKNIPVVVLTNSVEKKDADVFMKLGAALYLVKIENSPEEVVQKIEAVIKERK